MTYTEMKYLSEQVKLAGNKDYIFTISYNKDSRMFAFDMRNDEDVRLYTAVDGDLHDLLVNVPKYVDEQLKKECEQDRDLIVNGLIVRDYVINDNILGNVKIESDCVISENFILEKHILVNGNVSIRCNVLHGDVIIKGKINGDLYITNLCHGGVIIEKNAEIGTLFIANSSNKNYNTVGLYQLEGKINKDICIDGDILELHDDGMLRAYK